MNEWRKIYQEVIPIKLNNPKQIEESFKKMLTLECLGIHVEDVVDDFKQLYYFSVPEKSTLKVEFGNKQAEIAEDLIKIAKETLTETILDFYRSEFSNNEEDEEFYKDVKDNISDYALFFAKIRKGETWNKEMSEVVVKKIIDSFKNSSYKQV